jgi:hypothetical protein
MGMQLRCRCGANLVVGPGTLSVVCANCQSVVAVPQPEREFALSETVPAFQATADLPATPTMPGPSAQPAPTSPGQFVPAPARKSSSMWPIAIIAVIVAGGGLALAWYAMRGDPQPAQRDAAVVLPTPVDAAPLTAASPEELLVLERNAIGAGDKPALEALLAPDAFAFGTDAGQIATTGPAAAAMIYLLVGAKHGVASNNSRIAREGDIAWIYDDLEVGEKKFATTQVAMRVDKLWRVVAWHWATLVPNPVANQLAKDGKLPPPATVPDRPDDDHQVFDAVRNAFGSRQAYIDAYSERADAIDVGSAPRELVIGGATVKRAFTKIKADLTIDDGITAGRVGDRAGWAAANVNFTMMFDDGPRTQTFRVLAVLLREKAGWRLVSTQWSNAGPINP